MEELAAPLAAYAASTARRRTGPRQEYADSSYWESRFQETEGTFDWYATYNELGSIFEEFCPPGESLELLMVGCGNSSLSSELHEAGYRRITNIDIAPAAVAKMEALYGRLGMAWRVMDATAMEFDANRFGLTVDKGTLDAMMSGNSCPQVLAMVAEIYRTLRPGGLFVLVSHNGRRHEVLDSALHEHHSGVPGWERLDLRKCRLSPQATLINVLRCRLKGRPLADAFRDPEMMREAAEETRATLKRMAFLEAFRLFKAKKARQRQAAGEDPPAETGAAEEPGGEQADDPRKQPFCWVYVLRKPALGGTSV